MPLTSCHPETSKAKQPETLHCGATTNPQAGNGMGSGGSPAPGTVSQARARPSPAKQDQKRGSHRMDAGGAA